MSTNLINLTRHAATDLSTQAVVLPRQEPRDAATPPNVNSAALIASGSSQYHFGMHWNGGDTYNVVGYIGKGAFAMVYKLATKRDGEVFAVKQLEKRKFIKNGILDHKVNNELRIIKHLRHVSSKHDRLYVRHADIDFSLILFNTSTTRTSPPTCISSWNTLPAENYQAI